MNPAAYKHLSKVDKHLARVIRKVGPMTLPARSTMSPYQALVEAVVYQQLTFKAAVTILGRVKALFPGKRFPAPADLVKVKDRTLRGAGLSWAKVAALKDIAAKTIDGVVPTSRALAKMTNEQIVERLTELRGVGPWTVEMLLIFKMRRPDVLPCTDYGVRKGIALLYKMKDLPSPKEVLDIGRRWRPHCSTAAWYLWRTCDLQSAVK
jgi:DNA-3-methyladenine glycosylase II